MKVAVKGITYVIVDEPYEISGGWAVVAESNGRLYNLVYTEKPSTEEGWQQVKEVLRT